MPVVGIERDTGSHIGRILSRFCTFHSIMVPLEVGPEGVEVSLAASFHAVQPSPFWGNLWAYLLLL